MPRLSVCSSPRSGPQQAQWLELAAQLDRKSVEFINSNNLPEDLLATASNLIPLWPEHCEPTNERSRVLIVRKLRLALRRERARGVAGHWTYDLARHVQLLRVYRQLEALACIRPAARSKPLEA